MGYAFPDDEWLPFNIECELDAVGPAVRAVPQALVEVAAFFGIVISETTQARMERLWAAALCTDSLVDDAPAKYKADALVLFDQLMQGKILHDDRLPDWVIHKRGHAGRVVAIMHAAFAGTPEAALLPGVGMDIVKAARAKSRTPSLFWYLIKVAQENAKTTRMIELCMSETEHNHPARRKYMRWCITSSVSAALRDAWEDFSEDHQSGLTRVRPTPMRRRIIWLVWLAYSTQTLRNPRALRVTLLSMFEITPMPTQTRVHRALCALLGIRFKDEKGGE